MKCNDVRTFMSGIAARCVSEQIQPTDFDSLCKGGYISCLSKEDYDKASAEVSALTQLNIDQQNELNYERSAESTLKDEEKKTHSIMFHFENKEEKDAETQAYQNEKEVVSKVEVEVTERDAKIKDLIEKKSTIDRMVPYSDKYVSLTGLGVVTLNDLNVRNYRVSATDFSDFVKESAETSDELRTIAYKANFYTGRLIISFPMADVSQLWSISVGLGKLQGDPNLITQRFLHALDDLKKFKATDENKMMAAEILTSFKSDPSQPNDSDLQALSESLANLDREVRHDKAPKQVSAGIAALIMAGKRFDGTFPTDKFAEFSKLTASYESAALLSIVNVDTDQLTDKFRAFRAMFDSWGYEMSEDTELASAYLSICDLNEGDVNTKLAIIVDSLKNYLEYPLVASAIIASIPTLEANETLDLLQKAYTILGAYAKDLFSPELLSLSVRMIHGIRNELVKNLDPTVKITNTPIQFTYAPSNVFFIYYAPLIIAHSSYYATFSSIGGFHPAHVHGVGGFMG